MSNAPLSLGAAVLEPLADEAACRAVVEDVLAAALVDGTVGDADGWLLAHGVEGLTWGARAGDGWRLAAAAFPDDAEQLDPATLLSLRVFDPERETLVWRTGKGTLAGRVLADAAAGPRPVARGQWSAAHDDPLAPIEEWQLLLGNSPGIPETRDGFSLVKDTAGAMHVLPLVWSENAPETQPGAILVRHYLERDDDTGAVRVVASRLVRLDFLPRRRRS